MMRADLPRTLPKHLRFAAFLLFNAGLLGAWSWWLVRVAAVRGAANAAYAPLLACALVVLAELALGAAGLLRLPWLLAVLVAATALALVQAALAVAPAAGVAPSPDGGTHRAALLAPANLALALLAAFLSTWLLVAAWLLPPRGVDDLAYHLPPLYQAAQTGRIELLPLDLRTQFALPLGGDFLSLWPVLFFGTDTWVDGAALAVAAWAAAAIGALARALGATRRDALLAALAFLFLPVVVAQAGASYTDLAIVACHLVLLLATVRVWRDGRIADVAMAGLAAGFGLGVKYNMLVAIALAAPVLAVALWRHGRFAASLRGGAVFVVAFLPLPAYWLVRNAVLTGEPLYPYTLGLGGLRALGTTPWEIVMLEGTAEAGKALPALFTEPARLLSFLFRDPGLGSLNGGFGLVGWGLALPALAWALAGALRRREVLPAFLWVTAVAVFAVFLQQTDLTRLPFNMRLALVVPALGLVAFALALARLRADWPGAAAGLRAVVVGASAVAVLHLAGVRIPTVDIAPAAEDRRAGTATTPQRYYREAHGDLPSLATAFEPLDWLTLEGSGWSVYMAADWRVFMTAPLYGTRLQNRVWNFAPEPRGAPDALVFHTGFGGGADNLWYVRGRITPADAVGGPGWELVTRAPSTELWIAAARLAEPATRARLATWYERRYATEIAAVAPLLATLPEADVIVGAAAAIHGLRYHALAGRLATPVHLARTGDEAALARRLGARRVITVGAPVFGAALTRPLGTVRTAEGTVSLHYNELAS